MCKAFAAPVRQQTDGYMPKKRLYSVMRAHVGGTIARTSDPVTLIMFPQVSLNMIIIVAPVNISCKRD